MSEMNELDDLSFDWQQLYPGNSKEQTRMRFKVTIWNGGFYALNAKSGDTLELLLLLLL